MINFITLLDPHSKKVFIDAVNDRRSQSSPHLTQDAKKPEENRQLARRKVAQIVVGGLGMVGTICAIAAVMMRLRSLDFSQLPNTSQSLIHNSPVDKTVSEILDYFNTPVTPPTNLDRDEMTNWFFDRYCEYRAFDSIREELEKIKKEKRTDVKVNIKGASGVTEKGELFCRYEQAMIKQSAHNFEYVGLEHAEIWEQERFAARIQEWLNGKTLPEVIGRPFSWLFQGGHLQRLRNNPVA